MSHATALSRRYVQDAKAWEVVQLERPLMAVKYSLSRSSIPWIRKMLFKDIANGGY